MYGEIKMFCRTFSCYASRYRQWQSINKVLKLKTYPSNPIKVYGWIKSIRDHKDVMFIQLSDGSSQQPLQVVAAPVSFPTGAAYGSSVMVEGMLVESPGSWQPVELKAEQINLIGHCDPVAFPFKAKKHHTNDYLRQFLHLRPKSNMFSSILRLRSAATKAVHDFFEEEGYCHIHTPILTSNDCEGAGEIFQVEPADRGLTDRINREEDLEESKGKSHFFNVPTYLTVSGQLHLEVISGAIANVYTFGPTFRAENSRSRHHLSEFYMVEAELAFTSSLDDIMQVVERFTKSVCRKLLENCESDVRWLSRNVSSRHSEIYANQLLNNPFVRLSYTEAIDILKRNNKKFTFEPKWGCDLQKEHEKYLVSHCDYSPVFVVDFPTDLKPFYARVNSDEKTVAAVDLLAAGVGEICGGSVREERLPVLEDKIKKMALEQDYEWYLDQRRYGSAPHGGFGVGFERLLQAILGIDNIKDVIAFPRSTHNCKM